MRTHVNLSAKGLPPGTDYTAALSGLTVQNLDPPRTAWRGLVASARNQLAWRSGAGALLFVENLSVDNFCSASIVQTAEKIGAVDKVCKCLKTLKNPVNVLNVIHFAHFIRRVLC
jgi:hypothetical protein